MDDASEALLVPAHALFEQVGLAQLADTRLSAFAHGARRPLELAMTMALKPRVMLQDEPMAGMSHYESAAMVQLLQSLCVRYAVVLVEHDVDAVFALGDRITVMVYGRPIACGTADEIRKHLEVRQAYLGEQLEAFA